MKLPRSAHRVACLGLLLAILSATSRAADPAPDPTPKWDPARVTGPEDVAELKALQATVNAAVEKCTPATVALKYQSSSGSGVIITEDGLILTAAHVIRDYDPTYKGKGDPPALPFVAGKKVTVMLPDGKEVEAKTLGINAGMDSGMVQITEKPKDSPYFKDGKWAFRPVAKSADVKKGQWVMALGHPDGPKDGRAPVARLGRVLANNKGFLRTDCTIVGGDSGGPLFDLSGNVIGIHSRMVFPFSLAHNVHVPTDDFKTDWDKMLASEWVDAPPAKAYIGVVFPTDDTDDAWLRDVESGAPADKAGLKPGDTIVKFNETVVKSVRQFRKLMDGAKPGEKVIITYRRGTKVETATVTLTKRA
jgi:serine protease Do